MNPMTAEALDASPVHVGSRFRAVGHQRGRDWPSDLVVTECDRPTRFAFTATGGPIRTTEGHLHRHEFTFSEERGGTRLLVRRTDPIPSRTVRLLAPLITRYALRLRRRTIENLRQRLEGLGQPGLVGSVAG
jgi:ligand-binding SRPBCC domain-containing protein